MRRGIVALSVVVLVASAAHAAPGDPRLIQGVLEWPAKLTAEPFVVIRTDDGRWYYTEIKNAKRLESGPLTSGGRVAILGTEAAKPHEITAIAVGSGDAAGLALALMPHVNAPAAAAAPAASGEARPAWEKSAPVKGADSEPAAEPPRWAELQGTVKVIAGNWIVVRAESGQLVLVDLSTVRGGASSVRPGAPISVYGTPGEQKFQAMGILHSDNRPPAKPAMIPPRR